MISKFDSELRLPPWLKKGNEVLVELAPLRRAAQQLIDLGGVSDVRILQNGRVVTGIAGDRQRVYIQYQRVDAPTIEGEGLFRGHG
jgi:hypothetical protein